MLDRAPETVAMFAAVVSIVVFAYDGGRAWAVAALAFVLLYAAARP